MDLIRYSVVIPMNNEEESVEPLVRAVTQVMDSLGAAYELIIVDDGSIDGTLAQLNRLMPSAPRLTVVSFPTRQGKGGALQTGLDRARGEILVTLDGDLQNDPHDIPALLQRLEQGYDVVCGWRTPRNDPWTKRTSSKIGNLIRWILLREPLHDVGCSLRVFRRTVLQRVNLSDGKHRWFTWLAARAGFRIGEVKVRHHPRRFGRSHYGTWDRLIESCATLWRLRQPKECHVHESAIGGTRLRR